MPDVKFQVVFKSFGTATPKANARFDVAGDGGILNDAAVNLTGTNGTLACTFSCQKADPKGLSFVVNLSGPAGATYALTITCNGTSYEGKEGTLKQGADYIIGTLKVKK